MTFLSPVKIWRNQKKVQKLLGITGEIISWTKVHVPPSGFTHQAPYVVVVVELRNGRCISAQMVEWENHHLKIGQKVITILRKTKDAGDEGVIAYGVKVKPTD